MVRDHRQQATDHDRRQRRAVPQANTNFASCRVIAEALDVSLGTVQQWMAAAARDRDDSLG